MKPHTIIALCLALTACDSRTGCNKTSAAKVYFGLTDSTLSTSDVKRNIIVKTGTKKFYWRGKKVCYAIYKNVKFQQDMQTYEYVDNMMFHHGVSNEYNFKPQETTTVCYAYNKATDSYVGVTGEDCCNTSRHNIGISTKTEDICWL